MVNDVGDTWKRREPDSPCVNICLIHPEAGICIGCYRTADEIAGWGRMEAAARLVLKAGLRERAGLLKGARRGRARRLREVPKL